jgi:hypothetical protein
MSYGPLGGPTLRTPPVGDAWREVRIMMPNDTYRLFQLERANSLSEIRRADEQAARLTVAASSLFRGITRPVRAMRRPSTAAACGLPCPA